VILLAGAVLLSCVSGIACAIPAWHASKVDPMTALRCE
jgi:ABC-type lipoprotein release transport system permease subunit